MNRFLNSNKKITKETIIGLGEHSIRKNYYPELQDKVNALEKMRARNQALMQAIPDMLLVSDMRKHITPFSTASKQEAKLTLKLLRNRSVINAIERAVASVYERREPVSYEFELPVDETVRYFEARLHLTDMEEVLILIRDMTERYALEKQLRELAEIDHLTGLFNRRKFESVLMSFDGSKISNMGLIAFDVDGLKGINDTLGHLEGDRVLAFVAEKIKTHFEGALMVGRVGGNEFSVLYLSEPLSALEEKCVAFKTALKEAASDFSYPISVSYGIGHLNDAEVRVSVLQQMADTNMYQNKLLSESSGKSGLVKTLLKALEAKDYVTEGHTDRMAIMAEELGRAMKLEHHKINQLELLTKFHDLGKVGIPDRILKKEGPLTSEEWQVMKTHCRIGERIASASGELQTIAGLILHHHEKWDGTGYPVGLKGEAIPIECRILALVDAYDAMTNDRPYRKALSFETAIEEIKRCSGSQFDPELVVVFLKYLKELSR